MGSNIQFPYNNKEGRYSLQTTTRGGFKHIKNKKMKYAFILCLLIIVGCNDNKRNMSKTYFYIEEEIQFYNNKMMIKANYILEQHGKEKLNEFNNTLRIKIWDFYYDTKTLINIIEHTEPSKISFDYHDSVIKSINCPSLIENQIDTSRFFDTLYLHNVKFEYIKCLIKNSKYYDSMPDLKARIDSYKD